VNHVQGTCEKGDIRKGQVRDNRTTFQKGGTCEKSDIRRGRQTDDKVKNKFRKGNRELIVNHVQGAHEKSDIRKGKVSNSGNKFRKRNSEPSSGNMRKK
jgi:hypothetical protein